LKWSTVDGILLLRRKGRDNGKGFLFSFVVLLFYWKSNENLS
jgi:hypothetical protein